MNTVVAAVQALKWPVVTLLVAWLLVRPFLQVLGAYAELRVLARRQPGVVPWGNAPEDQWHP